jgi:hypothetical protein
MVPQKHEFLVLALVEGINILIALNRRSEQYETVFLHGQSYRVGRQSTREDQAPATWGPFFVTDGAATGQKFIVEEHRTSALTVPYGRVRYGILLRDSASRT